ncbi:hypothetical protein [Rhodococcoides trifolii]|nr:hypothetical protein [Rhodococcus trifolii]
MKGTVSGMRLPVPDSVDDSLHRRDGAADHIDDLVRMSINSVVGRRYA